MRSLRIQARDSSWPTKLKDFSGLFSFHLQCQGCNLGLTYAESQASFLYLQESVALPPLQSGQGEAQVERPQASF